MKPSTDVVVWVIVAVTVIVIAIAVIDWIESKVRDK